MNRKMVHYFIVMCFVILIDQVTKYFALENNMFVSNEGMLFGSFSDSSSVVRISLITSGSIIFFIIYFFLMFFLSDKLSNLKNGISFLLEPTVIKYKMTQIHAQHVSRSSKNKIKVNCFKGFVYQIDFYKHFKSHTTIVPDYFAMILGKLIGNKLQSLSLGSLELVKLKDLQFETKLRLWHIINQKYDML